MGRLGSFLFRHRGLVPVVPILAAIAFARPSAPLIGVGLASMTMGEAIRLWGAAHLGARVRSSRPRADRLVTSGPYASTRHPLYWGNGLLTVGFVLVTGAGWPWLPVVVTALYIWLYASHARREERALAGAFPEDHAAYRSRVPAWFWRAPAAPSVTPGYPDWLGAWRIEALSMNAEVWIVVAVWARVRWLH